MSLLFSVLSLFTACNILPEPRADTVRHFTLSGPATAAPVANGTRVRPVELAGYLRNRTMAVRVAENEVVYLEDVRWAEPLAEAITQLLRNRLAAVEGGATVTVQIQRAELARSDGNRVELAATYTILPAGGDLAARHATFTATPRKWDGKDHGTLVGQLREEVDELGDAIATAVAASPTGATEKR